MSTGQLDRCKYYIESQAKRVGAHPRPVLPTITISRQTGSGALAVAGLLADEMQRRKPEPRCPWAIFDRNLVEKIVDDHKLPETIKQFMPEKATSDLGGVVEELLGLHPNSWTLVQYTTETVLGLAHAGNAILIGRGSTIITARMTNVFHVRVVASEAARVAHVEKYYGLTHAQAIDFTRRTERERQSYIRQNFHANIEDPLLYHLVLNTSQMSFEKAAHLIAEGALKCV